MKDIILKTAFSQSVIHCGEGSFEKYVSSIDKKQCFVVTDGNLFAVYRHMLWNSFGYNNIILAAGESSKSLTCLKSIFEEMLKCGMQRNCTVVAFGGGVVGDIAGLAASLYMRGVKLVQIPTSLLAQVDSAVGGKTAVDFKNVKNLIGSFYQPEEVIVEPIFLRTLPQREVRCGLGEIIKYGALDGEIFRLLKANSGGLKKPNFIEEVTYLCLKHKAEVVAADERDKSGIRKTLNLGHTTGHAFELFYRRRTHGEFVLAGMYYEMYIAEKLHKCDVNYFGELRKLISEVIKVPYFEDVRLAAKLAVFDKKSADGKICLVVPESEGKCAEIKLSEEEYAELLSECAEKIRENS